jgi:TPR repeat protein
MGNAVFAIPPDQMRPLQEAALAGLGEAAYRIAQFHFMLTLDLNEGFRWMAISAENGFIRGMYALGFYLMVLPRRQDKIRARYWLEKVSRNGDGDEQTRALASSALKQVSKELEAMPATTPN